MTNMVKYLRIHSLILAILLLTFSPCLAKDKVVVLASLEWPPYTGKLLPEQGASSKAVREAFAAMGYQLEIRFLPWNRSLDEVRNSSSIDGYFPEYDSEERRKEFLYSKSMGKSPLGFAKRQTLHESWSSFDDLKTMTIGVVSGYVNTKQFDDLVKQGEIKTDEASVDLFNLRKTLAGRVEMAVIDLNVFDYLMTHDPYMLSHPDDLIIDSRLLGINDLYVTFKQSPRGEELRKVLNEGLSKIKPFDIQRDYFSKISR